MATRQFYRDSPGKWQEAESDTDKDAMNVVEGAEESKGELPEQDEDGLSVETLQPPPSALPRHFSVQQSTTSWQKVRERADLITSLVSGNQACSYRTSPGGSSPWSVSLGFIRPHLPHPES